MSKSRPVYFVHELLSVWQQQDNGVNVLQGLHTKLHIANMEFFGVADGCNHQTM